MKNLQHVIFLVLLVFLSAKADTDSLVQDSVAHNQDTVKYSADFVQYQVTDSILMLYGNAELQSDGMQLKADTIKYHSGQRKLEAWGYPVLLSDGNTVSGERMTYMLDTKRGKVEYGSARTDGDLYNGNLIARLPDESYLVKCGDYSTCDQDTNPHYYFWGDKMKILPGDKAVVRPFVLNIADVPVAILPYFIMPINKNRRSGFLTPRWGQISDQGSQGGFLNNIGYYWAINDYLDLEAKADFTNGEGFFFKNVRFNAVTNYALRYILSGMISAKYDITQGLDGNRTYWGLQYNHNQNIEPDGSFTLRGSGEMVADKNFYKRSTDERRDYLKSSLNSDISLSKSFRAEGVTISAKASYYQNLQTDENSMSLPQITFSSASRPLPFLAIDPDSQVSMDSLPWYKKLTWQYNSNLLNKKSRILANKLPTNDRAYDSANASLTDISGIEIGHSLSFGLPRFPKLWHITVTPHLNMGSAWYFKSRQKSGIVSFDTIPFDNKKAIDTLFAWDTVSQFRHIEDYSIGTSFGTQIYGVAKIGYFGISSFLHTISPAVGWSYSPEINNSDNLIGASGIVHRNRDEQQRVSVSLGNLFQLKTMPDKNGAGTKNITLLNLSAGTGYNFMAKNREGKTTGKWDNIGVTASTEHYGVNLSYRSAYDLYNPDESMRLSATSSNLSDRLPRLLSSSFSASTGLSLTGKFVGGDLEVKPENHAVEATKQNEMSSLKPWSLSASISVNSSKAWNSTFNVYTKSTSFSLSQQASCQFTENWSLAYSNKFDFESNRIVDQSLNLKRDFHCWEAVFDWIISGYLEGYYFRINIKEIPDIKFEKRNRQY